MSTANTPPVTVVAQDVRELKKALQKVPAVGSWFAEVSEHGHASLVCYDAFGNRHTIVRNKP
jgi:hypothetical protein